MAEPLVNGLDPRKKLYSALVGSSDKELAGQVKQFSYNKFNGLLDNNDFVRDLFMDISERGIVLDPKNPNASKDPVEFANAFIYREPVAKPQPKVQAAPAMQMAAPMEEEEAYTPPPQPLIGSSKYNNIVRELNPFPTPTLGETFGGVPAVFETRKQRRQEEMSPVFKAHNLAFVDNPFSPNPYNAPVAEEQRKAQRQFAKATKQEKEAALRGGTGFELQQKQANERREATKKLKDFGSSLGVTFDNMINKVKAAEALFGAKQRSLLTFGEKGKKAEEQEKKIKQQVLGYLDQVDQDFATKQAEYNIEGNIYDVISKGQLDRLPEAFAYNLAQIGINALGAGTTGGYSTFAQVVPDMYKAGVEEIARKTNTTPEEVIASGKDKEVIAYTAGAISGGIDYYSSGLLGKAMKSKGAYKFIRDIALDKIGKTKWKQAAASAIALGGVANIEGLTEGAQGLVEVAAPQVASAKSFEEARQNIYGELQKPSTQRRLASDIVGGAAGGGGLVAGGRGLERVLQGDFTYGDVRKTTQRADMDIVQTDNKIQERNKIAQAMEEAVKGNPEAEGQIREQYQKRVNEAAPTDEEVLNAYEGLAALPETEEKNTIRENLEAYMAEKGITPQVQAETVTAEEVPGEGYQIAYAKTLDEIPEEYRNTAATVERGTTRLGRFGPTEKVFAYRVPNVPLEAAPEATTEEDIAEDIPFEELPPAPTETAPLEEAPVEETIQEDEDLASLGQTISGLEQAPVEEAAPEVAPTEEVVTIAPLNIEFSKNEGRNVNYQGIEGRIKIDSDGAPYIFTRDGDVVYIEGGLSGQTPQQLGVQPLADDVINEADVETVLEDETAPLDQNQLQYDFDNNTITLYGRPFSYEGVETNSKGQTTALRLRDASGKIKFVRNEDTILEFEIQKELYEKSRTNKQPTIESATAAAEQLQVVPITRVEQVSEPVQQEGPTSDTKGDKVAPAPKGRKKAAPVKPAPAAPKKEEAPKPEPKKEEPKKEETPKPEAKEAKPTTGTPQEGDAVEIAPQREGGSPRKMVFKDGEWKQNVGGDIVKVGPSVQQQAQEMFGGKAEAKPAETKAEPTAKKIDKKSVQDSLEKAKEEYEKAKGAFDKKRLELDKTTREDVKDLFGERKVEMKAKGLFEMPRISPEQRERAIQPFRDRMNKAKEEVNRLTKMLEEGEEVAKELTFEKQKEYEQVQGVSKETRKGKSTPKTERVVRPKAKPIRNAGKNPDAITARNIAFYGDPVATTLQYLMDATYHPDLLESIFGGPSKTTKSGRKDISGERRSRIQFLDNNSNVKTADKLAEVLAERYAEENSIDVKDAEQQHDFASIAIDIVSSYSSRSQMVRELLRLNDQQSEAFDFMYNPEEIYGEGYNEDIAKDIDGILDELPDSYWEGKEISDEDFGNLFAEEVESETKAEAEFNSKQESSASQEFDGIKKPSKIKTKSFDGKHGKGAFERMKNITDNFEDIMDGMSGKIKQDCL